MKKLRIIVGGYIGLYPTGGATWDYIQYPLGLKLLGHDVYYIEDTAQYPVYQLDESKWDDCTATVAYLKEAMRQVGMEDRWAYRDVATFNWRGKNESEVKEIFKTADVFINISSSTYIYPEYSDIPVRIFLDSDPMFTQYEFSELMKEETGDRLKNFRSHTHYFTYGLNMGKEDCRIPDLGINWIRTIQPICLDYWKYVAANTTELKFSSILNWVERPPFKYNNESWGQKNIIFQQFEKLPSYFNNNSFQLIVNTGNKAGVEKEMQLLKEIGWKILSPHNTIEDMMKYKQYIERSSAEFSITKEAYIKSNSGWFSGRSACYLAAGKPVITQDTRWSKFIPAGEGLIAANDLQTAVDAVKEINADYKYHSKAAREIAEEYFESGKVLNEMLNNL